MLIHLKLKFNNKFNISTSKLNLKVGKKLKKFYIWSTAFYGTKTWDTSENRSEILESLQCDVGEE
jgi:hypothetical protein